jgi:hypothetical protein
MRKRLKEATACEHVARDQGGNETGVQLSIRKLGQDPAVDLLEMAHAIRVQANMATSV